MSFVYACKLIIGDMIAFKTGFLFLFIIAVTKDHFFISQLASETSHHLRVFLPFCFGY